MRAAVLLLFTLVCTTVVGRRKHAEVETHSHHDMGSNREEPTSTKLEMERSIVLPICLLSVLGLMLLMVPCMCCTRVTKRPWVNSFPWGSFVAFIVNLVGITISACAVDDTETALRAFGVDPDAYMTVFKTTFVMTVMINLMALVFSFIGVGCIRETLFTGGSASHPRLLAAAQFLVGPIGTGIVRVSLWITLVVFLVLSHCFLVFGLLVMSLAMTCHAGTEVVSETQTFIKSLIEKKVIWDADMNIENYCKGASGISVCGLYLCLGCFVAVVSQSGMLNTVAEARAHIESVARHHRDKGSEGGGPAESDDESELAHRDFGNG